MLGLELGLAEARLSKHGAVAVAGEHPVLLKRSEARDARPQLLVGDPDALLVRLLDDQGLLDQLVEHLLGEPEALDHLGREPLAVDLLEELDVVGVRAAKALGGDLLAVDAGDGVAAAPGVERPRPEVDDRGGDERDDDEQEHELQAPEVVAHAADHGSTTSGAGGLDDPLGYHTARSGPGARPPTPSRSGEVSDRGEGAVDREGGSHVHHTSPSARPGSGSSGVPAGAEVGPPATQRRATVMNPVWATMRWKGRTERPSMFQGRTRVSKVSTSA